MLYALLIISAILSSSLIISDLLRSSIRQTGFSAQNEIAYYNAESGAEKALYLIRKQEILPKEKDCGFENLDCELAIDDSAVSELSLNLAENESFQFDLFNPEKNSAGSGAESIGFYWSGAGTWLEISKVEWIGDSSINWPNATQSPAVKMLFSGGSATDNSIVPNMNYRVRVKALYGSAENLKIKLFSLDHQAGSAVDFPNFLKISVRGGFGESNQILNISLPRYAPTIGLYDYVLFSEEKILK